jgi:hypothetical protein
MKKMLHKAENGPPSTTFALLLALKYYMRIAGKSFMEKWKREREFNNKFCRDQINGNSKSFWGNIYVLHITDIARVSQKNQ